MVAFGMLFIAMTLFALWLRWRGTLWETRWLLWLFVPAVVPAFAANELGWVAAEVGRQPWIVYPTMVGGSVVGGLRTAHAVSEIVRPGQVIGSMIMFGVLYALLFVLWVVVLNDKIHHGPDPIGEERQRTTPGDYLDTSARRTGHRESLAESKEPA
jgi:cytochrome d ubiquinol oxidase subunit I